MGIGGRNGRRLGDVGWVGGGGSLGHHSVNGFPDPGQ